MVDWLRTDGWTRVLLVSSHMGNDAPLRCAVDRLRTDHLGALQIGLADTFHLTPEIWARFTDDGADLHANRAETNLVLYLDPASVDHDAMAEADDPDRNVDRVFSYPVALTSRNGVTGLPSDASADAGEALLIQMGEALAELLERAKTEVRRCLRSEERRTLRFTTEAQRSQREHRGTQSLKANECLPLCPPCRPRRTSFASETRIDRKTSRHLDSVPLW